MYLKKKKKKRHVISFVQRRQNLVQHVKNNEKRSVLGKSEGANLGPAVYTADKSPPPLQVARPCWGVRADRLQAGKSQRPYNG